MTPTILASIAVIVIVTVLLVILLLVIKGVVTPKGTVRIDINGGKKTLAVNPGNSLMNTLAEQKIFLPSACGGKANCGQCKVQVLEGGGEILPTETGFFNRKQIKDGWRLGCQVKVKDNLKIQVAESALSVKKLECEVISNENVATFIKEFTVRLPEGENLEFKSGEYIQIDIPEYEADFSDMGVADIYKGDWDKDGFMDLIVDGRFGAVLFRGGKPRKNGLYPLTYEGPLSSTRLEGHTTCPTAVDWNKDGICDLLVGAEDGHFYLIRRH